MDGLVQFLNDRLDEDERAAREAEASKEDWWWGTDAESACERHVARHSPGQVLRDIEVRRAIVEDLAQVIQDGEEYKGPDYYEGVDACERTLKRLALSYADHPDYRQQWQP